MSFLTSLLGSIGSGIGSVASTVGDIATSAGKAVGDVATKGVESIKGAFSSGKDAINTSPGMSRTDALASPGGWSNAGSSYGTTVANPAYESAKALPTDVYSPYYSPTSGPGGTPEMTAPQTLSQGQGAGVPKESFWSAFSKEATKQVTKNIKSSDMPPGTKGLATKKSGKYTPGVVGPDAPQGIRAVKGMEQESFKLDDETLKGLQKGLDDRARNRAAMAGYNAEKGKYSDLMPTEGSPYETPPEASYMTDEDWDKWLDNYYTNGYDQWSFND